MIDVNLYDISSENVLKLKSNDLRDNKQFRRLNKMKESGKNKANFLEDLINSNKNINDKKYPISNSIHENFQTKIDKNLEFFVKNNNFLLKKHHNTISNIHFFNPSNEKLNKNFKNLTEEIQFDLELMQVLEEHEDKVWQITWHPEEDSFASCGSDNHILFWAFCGDKYCLKAILEDSHTNSIRSITWNNNSGKYLASASFDSCINIWKKDGYDFDCIATLEGHEHEIKGVAWSSSGRFLATFSKDLTIWIWTVESESEFVCSSIIQSHSQELVMIKWSPVDDVLFSSSLDNTIKIWGFSYDRMDWVCLNTLNCHISPLSNFDISKDALFLVTVTQDKSMLLWRIEDIHYKKIVLIKKAENMHDSVLDHCSVNSNQDLISICSADYSIKLLKIDKKTNKNNLVELKYLEKAHEDFINCVCFHRKKNILLSCSDDKKIKVWKIKEQYPL